MKYNVSEESGLGKPYDTRIMMRLLAYIRPYRFIFFLTFLLVLIITASQLARPYIIKVAIDDHINGLYIPMVVINEIALAPLPDERERSVFEINGELLVRDKSLHTIEDNVEASDVEASDVDVSKVRQVVKGSDDQFYLIQGVIEYPTNPINIELVDVDAGTYMVDGYAAILLTDHQMQQFRDYDIRSLLNISAIFLIIIIVGFVVGYAKFYLLQYIGQRIVYDIREQAFAHLQKMSLSYFDGNPVGRLVTRITNDTENLNEMYTSVIINLFKDLLMIVGIMGILLYLDYRLALVSFATIPLMVIITTFYRKRARETFRELRLQLAKINSHIQENLSGIKIIQAFGLRKSKYTEFFTINLAHFKANYRDLILFALFRPSLDFVYALTLALLIWFGGGSVMQGAIQFGVLYAFIQYTEQFFRPIRDLAEKYNIMQSAMASSERLFQLLDEPEQIQEIASPTMLATPIQGRIEFDNVSFSYNDEQDVLKGVSFSINPGETIAIVGATGSGKTTILHLLARFYDIDSGSIRIDGVDIREMAKDEVRGMIGIVQQDVFLFTGDIKSNIHLNNPYISEQQVIEIAKYVNADAFIQKLPKKYNEPVTERGSTLSTGQRQLLAFARTLVHQPTMLLLDEATANIDTYTEQLIQDALPKIVKGRTTLIVAHRLSTIQNADRILVIYKGRLVEQGTHDELLKKQCYYYTLYKMQYAEA